MLCFWVRIWSLGEHVSKPLSPAAVHKPSTRLLPMQPLSLYGLSLFFRSWLFPNLIRRSYGATTSVPRFYFQIRCFMHGSST
jgi:hypothetical protein